MPVNTRSVNKFASNIINNIINNVVNLSENEKNIKNVGSVASVQDSSGLNVTTVVAAPHF